MITLFLLACSAAPTGDSKAPDTGWSPTGGDYTVTIAQTWDGDCVLDDMDTHYPADETWTLDPRDDGALTILPNYWAVISCSLDGDAFSCDLGSWTEDDGMSGSASLTHLLSATFSDATDFSGAFSLAADCSGSDCHSLKSTYGQDMVFPCSVSAAVSGVGI